MWVFSHHTTAGPTFLPSSRLDCIVFAPPPLYQLGHGPAGGSEDEMGDEVDSVILEIGSLYLGEDSGKVVEWLVVAPY